MWTEERVEVLKRAWSDGLSASQIAGKLRGVTRNAVIGKAHRLGLSGRGQKLKEAMGPDYRPRTRTKRQTKIATLKICATSRFVAKAVAKAGGVDAWVKAKIETAPEPLHTTYAEPALVSWHALEAHHCRFIPGDPAGEHTMFCGCKAVAGKSYCEAHLRRLLNVVQPTKPPMAWRDMPVHTGISRRQALALVR